MRKSRAAINKSKRKQYFLISVAALTILIWGFLQNPLGQFSDIRGFYGMRFMDGGHHWPYTPYIPLGSTQPLNPIEYPALTGLIVWGLTFFGFGFEDPILNYYYLNSFLAAILFMITVFLVARYSNLKIALLLLLSLASIRSLNLNWDIWAVVPMIVALGMFEAKKYTTSAALLAVSIATKFFPIVLLLPATIFFFREKRINDGAKYIFTTFGVWVAINLPFAIIDFSGWSYFYRFSFERTLGEGSFFNLFKKLGVDVTFSDAIYYLLNVLVFIVLIILLLKTKVNVDLMTTSFLAVFAFTIFGKQYSMQYALWLTPLAVLSIRRFNWRRNKRIFVTFVAWQIAEYFFHIAYFKNVFSRVMVERGVEPVMLFSDERYGIIALARYSTIVLFITFLVLGILKLGPIQPINKTP